MSLPHLFVGLSLLLSSFTLAQKSVNAGQILPKDQTYDFSAARRCRILAHQTIELQNDKHHLLVLDGGFGSFLTIFNGVLVRVLDLNPFTVAWDLSKDFSTIGLQPLWMYKKPNGTYNVPTTNHGGLWATADQNTICYHDGHYYNHSDWNSSLYHVEKSKIPDWQLWQMDVTKKNDGWKDITNETKGHELVNRTFAGAAASVPSIGQSFWIGGVIDATTSATTPLDQIQTTDQMIIYDHANKTVTRQKYYYPQSTDGVYQGDLVHLPIGGKQGYLMSLMSLKKSISSPWLDPDGPNGNRELGDNVTLNYIPMYDIETGTWFEQRTSWFEDQIPEPRTRFCSVVFYDQIDSTWNLWVHGGQKISDQNAGVRDIYVLSMPSFIWTKVETTLPDTNLIRSHTCHAIGGQLLIVGGYPPGLEVPTNATCDAEYLKVASISEDGVAWTGRYTTGSKYRNPRTIRNVVNSRTVPIYGFANSKLEADFKYQTPDSGASTRTVVPAVIGAVIVVAIIGIGLWFWRKRRNAKKNAPQRADTETAEVYPASPPNGQPISMQAEGLPRPPSPEINRRPMSSVAEVITLHRTGTHELETRVVETGQAKEVA